MSVAQMLALPAFAGAEVLAGADGLQRVVRSANVMEVPDIVPWVRAEGLLLTTGYPLSAVVEELPQLVVDLDARGVSAIAVKLHRYLDALPEEMLAEAERCSLPIIVLPEGTGFGEVLAQVFASVVSERASVLERSEEMHRQLVEVVLNDGDVSAVAAAVGRHFHGLAMVTTGDGRVVGHLPASERLDALRESSVFHPSGRFRTELSTPGVHVVEDLVGSHAVVRISGGRIDHGRLVLFHSGPVLTDADLAVLQRAASVAAIALTKEMAITAVESKYRGDFLRDVLAGRAGSPESVTAHAHTLGWDLTGPLVVVVAALEAGGAPLSRGYQGPLELERFAAAWRSVVGRSGLQREALGHETEKHGAVQQKDSSVPVIGFAAEVVALLPVPPGSDPATVVKATLSGVRGDGGGGRRAFATGVSRVVTGPDALSAAYEQARKALLAGRQLHGPLALTHFDDLGVFRLLSLIDDEHELSNFVEETLGALADTTSSEATDLRETLQVLLDTNMNVAETARRMHFHYNTLRYRIAKIERLVGPVATDPHLRLNLALALRIIAMRSL